MRDADAEVASSAEASMVSEAKEDEEEEEEVKQGDKRQEIDLQLVEGMSREELLQFTKNMIQGNQRIKPVLPADNKVVRAFGGMDLSQRMP